MKRFIKGLILFMGLMMFFVLNCMGAEAEWKCDSKGWWYKEGASWCMGWKQADGKWYYFDKLGYMKTGWVKENDKWYYLNEDGSMAYDCIIGNYRLGSDGAWIEGNFKQNLKSKMTKNSFKGSDETNMNYWLYSPENINDNKKLPLIIYLHGYWGENTDIDMVIQNDGLPKFLYDKTIEVPAYVLCPCSEGGGWVPYMPTIKELIEDLISKGMVDPDRVSITGHSMGAFGVWIAGANYPELFSCIVPVSGFMQADYIDQTKLNETSVWAFVGDKDTVVNPQSSIDSIKKLKELGGNAKLTEIKGATHNDTANLVYLDKKEDVLNWMISQAKKK